MLVVDYGWIFQFGLLTRTEGDDKFLAPISLVLSYNILSLLD